MTDIDFEFAERTAECDRCGAQEASIGRTDHTTYETAIYYSCRACGNYFEEHIPDYRLGLRPVDDAKLQQGVFCTGTFLCLPEVRRVRRRRRLARLTAAWTAFRGNNVEWRSV